MIIGISGVAGAGKDTSADFLVKNHGFAKVALADKVKRLAMSTFHFTIDQLWGSKKNDIDLRYPRDDHEFDSEGKCQCCGWELPGDSNLNHLPEYKQCYLTPRFALQRLGTEWGRTCYWNIWIDEALKIANQLLLGGYAYTKHLGVVEAPVSESPKGVVFSDIRFRNEVWQLKEKGHKLIRLTRSTTIPGALAGHISETEMSTIPDSDFDYVIDNKAPVVDSDTGEVLQPGTPLSELERKVTMIYESLC